MSKIKEVLPNINERHCDVPLVELEPFAERIKVSLEEHKLDASGVNELRLPPLPPEQDPHGRYYDKSLVLRSPAFVLTIYMNKDGWRNDIIHMPEMTIGRGSYHAVA
jgi:hypothetical protein